MQFLSKTPILDVEVKLSSYAVIMRIWKCPHITFHHNCQAPFPPFSFGLAEWWLLWRLRVLFQFLDLSVLGFVCTLTPDSTVFAFLGSLCFCLKCFPSLIIGDIDFCLGLLSMLTKKKQIATLLNFCCQSILAEMVKRADRHYEFFGAHTNFWFLFWAFPCLHPCAVFSHFYR